MNGTTMLSLEVELPPLALHTALVLSKMQLLSSSTVFQEVSVVLFECWYCWRFGACEVLVLVEFLLLIGGIFTIRYRLRHARSSTARMDEGTYREGELSNYI